MNTEPVFCSRKIPRNLYHITNNYAYKLMQQEGYLRGDFDYFINEIDDDVDVDDTRTEEIEM